MARLSLAKFSYDEKCLYVAAYVTMFAPAKMSMGSVWGQDDGVELCIAGRAPDGIPGTFVIRSYAGGAVESVTDAGVSQSAASLLDKEVRFAAKLSRGSGGTLTGWRGEWAIPFAALGLKPEPGLTVAFNMAAFCSEFSEWHCWEGTLAENWRLDQAGTIKFVETQ